MKYCIPAYLLIGICSSALADVDMTENRAKTALDVSVALTWRSNSATEAKQPWRIPGIMMGGKAWPVEQGLAVDETYIQVFHAIDDHWYGVLKIGTHGGSSDHNGPELEHAYFGWRNNWHHHGLLAVEGGKLIAAFSPEIMRHAADRTFTESPLVIEAFLGKNFHDEGVRTIWRHDNGFSAGMELWNGTAYPATSGEDGGSADTFSRYEWSNNTWFLQTGLWLMHADASLRSDHRYADNYQHNTAFTIQIPDVRFTGSTDLLGVHGHLRWNLDANIAFSLQGEWIQMQANGDLFDGTRMATLQGDYSGGWIQTGFHWQQHGILVRAEELSLENTLAEAGAAQLMIDANLADQGKNPSRMSIGWHWQWQPALTLHIETVSDKSMIAEQTRIAVGIVWRERLWSRQVD